MPRPKHIYTPQEIRWILSYIERKFKLDPYWPKEDYEWKTEAREAFAEIQQEAQPSPLEDWCATWLDKGQKKRLDNALRAWRKRRRDISGAPKKNITLEYQAWLYLSELAKRDNVTISQYLTNRLEQEYFDIPLDTEA
jgi:macrodomain Ter protein organizer (MatP/YcbG family)